MLSKNKVKNIQSLSHKKGREETGLFIAEGEKLITELIQSGFQIDSLIALEEKMDEFKALHCEKIIASVDEIKKISSLKTPPSMVAVCFQRIDLLTLNSTKGLTIVLDNIQDPGNFGTIIRLASWFGIDQIICSENTVDCYNPKVIQATMGAIAHVKIIYTDILSYLSDSIEEGRAIYGTYIEGENIYNTELVENGIVVFGNEGNGISEKISELVPKKISIPTFAKDHDPVESLNVSIAASIVCSEFRRRNL